MAACSSAICMRLDYSMEPLRIASRSILKGPGIFDRPGQPGLDLARSWLGLKGRLLARPLVGLSCKERGDDPGGGRHAAEASTLCLETFAWS